MDDDDKLLPLRATDDDATLRLLLLSGKLLPILAADDDATLRLPLLLVDDVDTILLTLFVGTMRLLLMGVAIDC